MSLSPSRLAKSAYVSGMRGAGLLASQLGALRGPTPPHRSDRNGHWLRSLFAIHDIDALVALDVPWWTYDAICEVEDFLASRPGARVFEYGSGASTVWLARRAGSVFSVEHDAAWCALVRQRLAALAGLAPVNLALVEPETGRIDPAFASQKPGAEGLGFAAYVHAIDAHEGAFDLIVIDGRARGACLAHARSRLASDGLIVFDNSHRARYRAPIESSGMAVRRLAGRAPSLPYPDETSLLRRADAAPA
ncbi:O-methyltransferase [Sandarakinorhabdus rubra]|uniref:class I SAM-dependent methyltransferase n=1 Tax=Sandarakinorhabdus rubra TaxID=2672568 RepID=UPI001969DCB9|nr:class I SAM-dependent methyltransferase [Sandarakinorhabdus rubra]